MKKFTYGLLLPVAAAALLLVPGCYTQLGTVHDERDYAYQSEEEEYAEQDTISEEEYNQARERFYESAYDSYYPGWSYGLVFGSPWYWRYNSWYYYDPYIYDPWGWCGTGYPAYYYPYHHWYHPLPLYGYRPSTVYGPSYRGGSGYVTRDGGPHGTTRTFGSTRSGGAVRTSGSSSYTPATRQGSTGTTALPTGRVNTGARGSSGERGGTSVDRGSSRSSGGREGSVRREAPRTAPRPESGTRSGGRREDRSSVPPSTGGGSSGNPSSGRDAGGSGGRTYSPPPPPPSPPPSQPPSSSGGSQGRSAPANTGERGGTRR